VDRAGDDRVSAPRDVGGQNRDPRTWLGEIDGHLVTAAQTVADAALRAGQLALSGTPRRRETDLLGITLTGLRPRSALRAHGQYYTPAAGTQAIAALLGVDEQSRVADPAMGTGGMFRAVAASMRARGLDPTTVAWVGNDVDPLAVACAAVNSLIWGLGPDLTVWCANSLSADADRDYDRASAARRELLDLAQLRLRCQMLRAALAQLHATTAERTNDRAGAGAPAEEDRAAGSD
jgi:hypothetical protein